MNHLVYKVVVVEENANHNFNQMSNSQAFATFENLEQPKFWHLT